MPLLVVTLTAVGVLLVGARATVALRGYVAPRTVVHSDGGFTSNENVTVTRTEDSDAGVTTLIVQDH